MAIELEDTSTKTDAKAALAFFMGNADQLEQISRNLRKTTPYLDRNPSKKIKVYGYTVEKNESSGQYNLLKDAQKRYLPDSVNSAYSGDVYNYASGLVNQELAALVDKLGAVGRIAHETHLDLSTMNSYERDIIEKLPALMDDAKRMFDATAQAIASPGADNAALADATQFKRDSNLLAQLIADYKDNGTTLIAHNDSILERQAKLLTTDEIDADKDRKYTEGMKALGASYDKAKRNNPSFRARIKHSINTDIVQRDDAPAR